jgi:hypothetical protein
MDLQKKKGCNVVRVDDVGEKSLPYRKGRNKVGLHPPIYASQLQRNSLLKTSQHVLHIS